MSINSIIKQAMIDAGMNPEMEKKATGNKLADDLYALAAECEKLGSARVGVAKSAEQSCLRDLTKAYLFQRMLKSAVEDRLGVTDTEFEKSAGEHEADIRYEYIEAFEKLAAEKSAIDMKTLAKAVGAGLGMAGVGYGGYKLVEREGRIGRELADAPEHKGLVEAVKGMDNALLDYNVRHGHIRNNTPWYPKKQAEDKESSVRRLVASLEKQIKPNAADPLSRFQSHVASGAVKELPVLKKYMDKLDPRNPNFNPRHITSMRDSYRAKLDTVRNAFGVHPKGAPSGNKADYYLQRHASNAAKADDLATSRELSHKLKQSPIRGQM